MANKKAPPYSKTFLLPENYLPLAWLYCGPFSWEGKNHPLFSKQQAVVLPPGDDPQDYFWDFLKGCIVFGIVKGQTDKLYRKSIARELIYAGAIHVRFILPERKLIGLNYPDFYGDIEREEREGEKYLEIEQKQDAYYLTRECSEFDPLLKGFEHDR